MARNTKKQAPAAAVIPPVDNLEIVFPVTPRTIETFDRLQSVEGNLTVSAFNILRERVDVPAWADLSEIERRGFTDAAESLSNGRAPETTFDFIYKEL